MSNPLRHQARFTVDSANQRKLIELLVAVLDVKDRLALKKGSA
jgi:hypothetical protein